MLWLSEAFLFSSNASPYFVSSYYIRAASAEDERATMARKWSSAEALAAERANAAAMAEADRDEAQVKLTALQRSVDEVISDKAGDGGDRLEAIVMCHFFRINMFWRKL